MASRGLLILALVAGVAGTPAGQSTGLAVPGRSNAYVSIAASGSSVALAWGASTPAGAADVYLATSRDGGRTFATPIRVSEDRWVLDGCPENGPALAVDGAGRIQIAWPTLVPGATPKNEPTIPLLRDVDRRPPVHTPAPASHRGVPRSPADRSRRRRFASRGLGRTGRRKAACGACPWDRRRSRCQLCASRRRRPGPATYPVVAATPGGTVIAWTSGRAGATVLRTEWLAERR